MRTPTLPPPPPQSFARHAAREIGASIAVSAVAAAVFTALGFIGTFVAATLAGRTADAALLNEREVLAIAVPTFLGAWAWCLARKWMMRGALRTVVVTALVGVGVSLANRLVLTADVEDAFARDAGFFEKASGLVGTVGTGMLHGLERGFDVWRDELVNPASLLWFSVYGTVIAVGVALAMRRTVKRTSTRGCSAR